MAATVADAIVERLRSDAKLDGRPVVIEAIVDPAVPLLPPHLPQEEVAMLRRGLAQDPAANSRPMQVDRQLADEGQ